MRECVRACVCGGGGGGKRREMNLQSLRINTISSERQLNVLIILTWPLGAGRGTRPPVCQVGPAPDSPACWQTPPSPRHGPARASCYWSSPVPMTARATPSPPARRSAGRACSRPAVACESPRSTGGLEYLPKERGHLVVVVLLLLLLLCVCMCMCGWVGG